MNKTKMTHSTGISPDVWCKVNNELNAKIFNELQYEEVIKPTVLDAGNSVWQWEINGVCWQFNGTQHIWGNLVVDEDTITRNGHKNINSAQLIKDIASHIALSEITLGNFLEEIQQTLFADLTSHNMLAALTSDDVISLSGIHLQARLKGHPKALANKGRLGWGINELQQYSPESAQSFQLRYLAVKKTISTSGITEIGITQNDISANGTTKKSNQPHRETVLQMLTQMMSSDDIDSIFNQLTEHDINLDEYWVIPTHPWQFSHYILPQFTALFASEDIIDLGIFGDYYQAQQSIRTLSNMTSPRKNDVKLPITILNTSCYRGIPAKYITSGAALSEFIDTLCQSDPLLKNRNFHVLKEWAGIHVTNPNQHDIAQTPYRYNEMLGVILRQSPAEILPEGECDRLAAALMQTDAQGKSFIGQYIQHSGLSIEDWLTALFDATVIPLYHLMCQYGIALVSHGQNITLLMNDTTPSGIAIKDFHGDLRLIDEDFPELTHLPDDIKSQLTRLPAQYLLHDLYTGHFVTVLRFVSPYLAAESGYTEKQFYLLLSARIRHYQAQHPALQDRFAKFDILAPTMEKICINRVRFNIGYQDTTERLLPALGTPLNNPLYQG